jgi:transposase
LSRGDVTAAEWRVLRTLLPNEPAGGENDRDWTPPDSRSIVNGILWHLRTGAEWCEVPRKYGNWGMIHRRFLQWSASGVWETVAFALAEMMAKSGRYNIDSATFRAGISAADGNGELINELLAARGAGSPVEFIVLRVVEGAPKPSPSRRGKQPGAKPANN